MSGRELVAWLALAVAVVGWLVVLLVLRRQGRAPTRAATLIGSPVRRRRRDEAAEYDLSALREQVGDGGDALAATVAPVPDLFPGVPDTHLLTECPMVDAPGGPMPLRDWLRHFAGVDAWPQVVTRFYTRAGADPDIAGYFADVDLPRLQRHFLAALMIVTGQGVTVGVVRRMHTAHAAVRDPAGQPITGAIWNAVIKTLAGVLAELGTPSATLVALSTTIAPIRATIVTEPEAPVR